MNYKVLYRKYRPTAFDEIIGQDYIVETLKNSIRTNSISHAYIFSGPRGTGKTTTAKVFAKAINCANPIDGSPCGKCDFCVNFNDNPDIIELDAASNNGVDDIRQLIDNIKLTPTNGKYKVYIIDEVHMLTTNAFNALLLTLEEPPKHSIFILATTNIESVPITILSRCQRYDFQKISIEEMTKRMAKICEVEDIHADEDALTEIAYYADGGMRDALSLLDQLSKGNENITLDYVENHIKIISKKTIDELFNYLEENKVNECLNLIQEFREKALDYKTLIKRLIDAASIKAKNIMIAHVQKRLNIGDYKKLILELVDSLNKININVDSYTILEMILLNYFDTKNAPKEVIIPEKKVENVSNLKENKEEIVSNPIVNNLNNSSDSLEKKIEVRINNCFCGAQKKYLESLKMQFENLMTNANLPGKVKSILLDSTLVAASDTNLIFATSTDHNATNANNSLKEVEDYINKTLNSNYKIIFISNDRWNIERNKYIENLKVKKNYVYIAEEEKEEDLKEDLLNDIFDPAKIEII